MKFATMSRRVLKIPNWCYNALEVYGTKEQLEGFAKAVSGKHKGGEEMIAIDFNKLIPYPKKFDDMDLRNRKYENLIAKKNAGKLTKKEKNELLCIKIEHSEDELRQDGYNQGGYEWCSNFWNTKWNASEVELEKGIYLKKPKKNQEISWTYRFNTAWSSPTPVIAEMSKRFPKLKFELEYTEEGASFEGKMVCSEGQIKEDVCVDTHSTEEGWKCDNCDSEYGYTSDFTEGKIKCHSCGELNEPKENKK